VREREIENKNTKKTVKRKKKRERRKTKLVLNLLNQFDVFWQNIISSILKQSKSRQQQQQPCSQQPSKQRHHHHHPPHQLNQQHESQLGSRSHQHELARHQPPLVTISSNQIFQPHFFVFVRLSSRSFRLLLLLIALIDLVEQLAHQQRLGAQNCRSVQHLSHNSQTPAPAAAQQSQQHAELDPHE
jgi:hypothetical protein